jgi:hypothetical protein
VKLGSKIAEVARQAEALSSLFILLSIGEFHVAIHF